MANKNYDEDQQQQHDDEAAAWVQCRMLRQRQSADSPFEYRVLFIDGQTVIADLYTYQTADDEYIQPAGGISSYVGERLAEKKLRDSSQTFPPFMPSKLVNYNTLTHEVVVLRRTRNRSAE